MIDFKINALNYKEIFRLLFKAENFILPVATLICFFIYYFYFKFEQGCWSVVTIAAIYRPNIHLTLIKSLLRIVGSLMGCGLGYLLFYYFSHQIIPLLLLLFLIGFLSCLCSLTFQAISYSFTMFYLNMLIVMDFSLYNHLNDVPLNRTLSICLGILVLACVYIILILSRDSYDSLFKKIYYDDFLKNLKVSMRPILKAKEALVISGSILITVLTGMIFHNANAIWSTIVILLFFQDNLDKIRLKSRGFFLGDILALVISMMVSLYFAGQTYIPLIVLFLGLWLCAIIINHGGVYSNFGTHCAISLSIMLLLSYPNEEFNVILERFKYVCLGILLGNLSFWIIRFYLKEKI